MMQIYYFIFNVCLEDFSNMILKIINFVLRSQFLHMKNLLYLLLIDCSDRVRSIGQLRGLLINIVIKTQR